MCFNVLVVIVPRSHVYLLLLLLRSFKVDEETFVQLLKRKHTQVGSKIISHKLIGIISRTSKDFTYYYSFKCIWESVSGHHGRSQSHILAL